MKIFNQLLPLMLVIAITTPLAHAGPITGAIKATINSGGNFADVDNNISNSLNQSGLYDTYLDNVTDFDNYLATRPFHSSDYNNQEWFSAHSTASITYDLGRLVDVDAVALWNEESAGIKYLDLFGSVNGTDFFSLAMGLSPTDNPFDQNQPSADYRYSAEVFKFSAFNLQYVRFDISGCLNDTNLYGLCSIGEVAFRTADIPEPGTFALLSAGFIGLMSRKIRYRVTKQSISSQFFKTSCKEAL